MTPHVQTEVWGTSPALLWEGPKPSQGREGWSPSAPAFPGEPDRAQQGPGASLPRQGHQLPFPDPDVLALLWSGGGLYVAGEGQPPCPGGLRGEES